MLLHEVYPPSILKPFYDFELDLLRANTHFLEHIYTKYLDISNAKALYLLVCLNTVF